MAYVIRRDCKCDLCGFEWIPRKKKDPTRCASNKCQSRMWNHKQAEVINLPKGYEVLHENGNHNHATKTAAPRAARKKRAHRAAA